MSFVFDRRFSSILNRCIDRIFDPCKDLSDCQVGVRELSYAQNKVAQWTPDLYRSPNPDCETRGAFSQLNGDGRIRVNSAARIRIMIRAEWM
jgi:hypothetical protein